MVKIDTMKFVLLSEFFSSSSHVMHQMSLKNSSKALNLVICNQDVIIVDLHCCGSFLSSRLWRILFLKFLHKN